MNQNKQKYISFIVVILIIISGVFLLKSKSVIAPVDNIEVEIPDDVVSVPDKPAEIKPNTDNTQSNLTTEQKDLLVKLQKAADARDFDSFASALLEVYKNRWGEIADFKKAESEFYMYTYDTYFLKGDLANALKFSTIVYDKVPEAWRFRYIRILTLEKYGRDAFNAGDLNSAENYANKILRMMFRLEGTNLLADVYISKIRTNIKDGNTNLAKQNLGFIWDYEVSQDRRDTLTNLKTQLGM